MRDQFKITVAIQILSNANPKALSNLLLDSSRDGNLRAVQILLDAGADVNLRGTLGYTALHWAAGGGHTAIAEALIAKGAIVDGRQNYCGATPLLLASAAGQTEMVDMLITRGANFEARDGAGWTPLHWAAYNGHMTTTEMLIRNGADAGAQDMYGHRTPLELAVLRERTGTVDAIRLVRSKGAMSVRVVRAMLNALRR